MKEDYAFRKTEFIKAFNYLQRVFRLNLIPLDGVFVAGGALRDLDAGTNLQDIDIYCTNHKALGEVERALSKVGEVQKFPSKKAITFKIEGISIPVQLIKIMVGPPEDVVDQFDFVQNSLYTTFSKFKVVSKPGSGSWNLKMCDRIKTPKTMLTRVVKMINKGRHIEKRELIKLLKIVESSLEEYEDTEKLTHRELGNFYGNKY